jgi:hypothetical protein
MACRIFLTARFSDVSLQRFDVSLSIDLAQGYESHGQEGGLAPAHA